MCLYAECLSAECLSVVCLYAEYRYAEVVTLSAFMLSVVMPSVLMLNVLVPKYRPLVQTAPGFKPSNLGSLAETSATALPSLVSTDRLFINFINMIFFL